MNDDDNITLLWPDRPTCHDHDPLAQRFEPSRWRPADERQGYRTCSHCGSMHPEDLYSAVLAGAKLGGSDWKYGWPHKFYVTGIPNTNVGKLSQESSMSLREDEEPSAEDLARAKSWLQPGGEVRIVEHDATWGYTKGGNLRRSLAAFNPQRSTTHGKWYNTHLQELNPVAFSAMVEMLAKQTHIRFEMVGHKLHFMAPRAGYQRD